MLIAGVIAVGLFCFASGTKSSIKLELSLRRWGMGRVVVIESESSDVEITRRTTYRFGPLGFLRTERIALVVLGTNELRVGDIGYNPPDKQGLWSVLAVEQRHEFEDGTARPGVLLRFVNGGEGWVPREKIGKVLVGR